MSWFGVDFYPICPFYLRFSTDNDGWMSPTDWLFSPLRWWQYDMITYQLAMLSRFFTTFLLIWPCLLWPCFKSISQYDTSKRVWLFQSFDLSDWQGAYAFGGKSITKYKSILCMTCFVHDNSTKIKISKITVPKIDAILCRLLKHAFIMKNFWQNYKANHHKIHFQTHF